MAQSGAVVWARCIGHAAPSCIMCSQGGSGGGADSWHGGLAEAAAWPFGIAQQSHATSDANVATWHVSQSATTTRRCERTQDTSGQGMPGRPTRST